MIRMEGVFKMKEFITKYRPYFFVGFIVLLMMIGMAQKMLRENSVYPMNSSTNEALFLVNESIAAGDASRQTEKSKEIVVHISGEVKQPSIVHMTDGARLYEAIEKVGGFTEYADQNNVNLAGKLMDGAQYVIPRIGEVSALGSSATKSSGSQSLTNTNSLININTATLEELMKLNGVGESTGQKIIQDREINGPFRSIEDIKRVSGIGEKKFEAIMNDISI